MMNSSDRTMNENGDARLVARIRGRPDPTRPCRRSLYGSWRMSSVPYRSNLRPRRYRNWMHRHDEDDKCQEDAHAAACPKLKLLKAVR